MFAWTGAAAFVVSLAYFFYSYFVTYGEPAVSTAPGAVPLDVALFTLFALHHSVFAREGVRARVTRLVPAGRERSAYVWVASLLFIAVCALWQPVAGVLWRIEGVPLAALWVLQLLGAWMTLRSAAVVGIRELAGLAPPAGPTRLTRPAEFKTVGPYGWVRHPIYTGWFLLVFAASPMTGTRLAFAIMSCAYLLLAIPLEERSLRATTNGAYERYAQQVRWKLVPGVY